MGGVNNKAQQLVKGNQTTGEINKQEKDEEDEEEDEEEEDEYIESDEDDEDEAINDEEEENVDKDNGRGQLGSQYNSKTENKIEKKEPIQTKSEGPKHEFQKTKSLFKTEELGKNEKKDDFGDRTLKIEND